MYIVAVAWVERDLGFGHNLEGAQGIKSERSFQGGVPYHNLTSSQIYMKNILWIQDRSLLDPSSNSGGGGLQPAGARHSHSMHQDVEESMCHYTNSNRRVLLSSG